MKALRTASQSRDGKSRRRLAGQIRHEQIVLAATKLFREKGYHGTTMQDIAEAVRLQKGSLYLHIASKDELLFQIVSTGVERTLRELEEIYKLPLSPADKLKEAVRYHIGFTASEKDVLGVLLEDSKHLSLGRRKLIAGYLKRYEQVFESLVEEGMRCGEFRSMDVKVVSFAFLGMCNWLYRWYSKAGRLGPEQIANIFVDLILGSIGALPSPGASNLETMPVYGKADGQHNQPV